MHNDITASSNEMLASLGFITIQLIRMNIDHEYYFQPFFLTTFPLSLSSTITAAPQLLRRVFYFGQVDSHSYMFARMAAPPNKAAAPMAPVWMGAAKAEELLLDASGLPAELSPTLPVFAGKPEATALLVEVRASLVEVGEGTLEV
jgi:hypothetical protein